MENRDQYQGPAWINAEIRAIRQEVLDNEVAGRRNEAIEALKRLAPLARIRYELGRYYHRQLAS